MSKIEWTDITLNPGIYGCSKVSPACTNCYAMGTAQGLEWKGQEKYRGVTRDGQWTGEVRVAPIEEAVEKIRRLPKPRGGKIRKVFVTSMSDMLHESIPIEWTAEVIMSMARRRDYVFQVLTKRAHRLPALADHVIDWPPNSPGGSRSWPSNVWIGVTVEDQKRVERVEFLKQVPAAVRFVSVEPLIEGIDLEPHLSCGRDMGDRRDPVDGVDWVICGGESGPNARPMHTDWARSIRDQCQAAGVPFFMKQMSGRSRASLKDIPADLMIREFPGGAA